MANSMVKRLSVLSKSKEPHRYEFICRTCGEDWKVLYSTDSLMAARRKASNLLHQQILFRVRIDDEVLTIAESDSFAWHGFAVKNG